MSLIDVSAYLGPSGTQLLAATYVPAGAVVRVTIMAEHELSATADTIPARHRLPVAQYAAHLLCHQLATHYSAQREAAMGSDASMTESRARQFADRARELRTAYFAGVGLPDPFKAGASSSAPGAAAAAVVSWPSQSAPQPGAARPAVNLSINMGSLRSFQRGLREAPEYTDQVLLSTMTEATLLLQREWRGAPAACIGPHGVQHYQ